MTSTTTGLSYNIRPIIATDLSHIAEWISRIAPSAAADSLRVLDALKTDIKIDAIDPDTGPWMMEINKKPAFAIFHTDPTGMQMPMDARLSLIYGPAMNENARKILLAWQAATVFLLLKKDQVLLLVDLPPDNQLEAEALTRLGYRFLGQSKDYPYHCSYGITKRELVMVC